MSWRSWGLLLVLFALSWWSGRYERMACQLATAKQAAAESRVQTSQAEVTTQVVTQYVDRIRVVHAQGEALIKEVPIYVPTSSTSSPVCTLSGGFRVFHDAAAAGELPQASQIADAASVPPSTLATTLASNYQLCHTTAEQLRGLQQWVSKQAQLTASSVE
jgi:hypothetical protein